MSPMTYRPRAIRPVGSRPRASWVGRPRLDLEPLAWETAEHLRDITIASDRTDPVGPPARAQRYWAGLYGDDLLLLSLPGMGPMTAPHDPRVPGRRPPARFRRRGPVPVPTPTNANGQRGVTGNGRQPTQAITKKGPARAAAVAFYQAATSAAADDSRRCETGALLPSI